jgi:glycosyltransferase involved in cell wall biosynthesis
MTSGKDTPMKIAHIAPPWISVPPKNYGGTEAIISYIVEEHVAQGHDVTLFSPGDAYTSAKLVSFFPRSLFADGVPWSAHAKAYYHLHKALERADEFDIVHTHLSSSSDIYLFPLMAPLVTPHVTTIHSNFPFDYVSTWNGDADEYFLEWMQQAPIVTVSEKARANLPYDLNCVGVVHLGIPMELYPFCEGKREDFFVWLGRITPEKGPHLAIQAAKRAGVPLVLAGIVDQRQPAAIAYFEREIQPWIDGNEVRYIGPVNLEQKVELLSKACGFLNPITWEEPGATVIIESMALGCTVISFARGVLPELLQHGKTGFLAQDLDEMVAFIRRVDELDRREIHLYTEEHLSAQVMAEKYLSIYKRLIAQNRFESKYSALG